MGFSFELFFSGLVLALIQFLAALPWVWAIDPVGFRKWSRDGSVWLSILGGVVGLAVFIMFVMFRSGDPEVLNQWGRIYAALLHLQLIVDFIIIVSQSLVLVWPKGGAVALAALREGIRQPLYWLIFLLAAVLMTVSMTVPFFTFGEDYKMMKQLAFDLAMLAPALFGLLASSISIYDEIEGRTAITLMSKPVNRRQYLLGKYLGMLMATGSMTLLLGWVLTGTLIIKPFFDKLDDVVDVMPIQVFDSLRISFVHILPASQGEYLMSGSAFWFGHAFAHHIGVLLGFGQVMVLLAICVALATRMQFVLNLVICLIVFIIGHLAPVLADETTLGANESNAALSLVNFIAQLLNAVFPALEYFDIGPAIIRDQQITLGEFITYVGSIFFYSILYTGIALFGGLILFDDRDLA
jgi:ABC-type transport system involved in multi-copper enzyme maturation permease subunit